MNGLHRGQVLPLFALCLAALLGFAGLGVDVGYLEYWQNSQQAATDAAAIGAAQQRSPKDAATKVRRRPPPSRRRHQWVCNVESQRDDYGQRSTGERTVPKQQLRYSGVDHHEEYPNVVLAHRNPICARLFIFSSVYGVYQQTHNIWLMAMMITGALATVGYHCFIILKYPSTCLLKGAMPCLWRATSHILCWDWQLWYRCCWYCCSCSPVRFTSIFFSLTKLTAKQAWPCALPALIINY